MGENTESGVSLTRLVSLSDGSTVQVTVSGGNTAKAVARLNKVLADFGVKPLPEFGGGGGGPGVHEAFGGGGGGPG